MINHVFQGDHIDSLVDVDIPAAGRQVVSVRSSELRAMHQWPVGSVVALTLPHTGLSVFKPAA